MLLDKQTLLSDEQALTSTAVSDNIYDFGDLSNVPSSTRKGFKVLSQVVEDFAGGTDLTVSIETDDDETFASPTTLITSETVPLADLVAGKYILHTILPDKGVKRYVRANYTVNGAMTAGKVSTGFVIDVQQEV